MPAEKRVLVVGTTGDYIHWISKQYPGQALFLTDPWTRHSAPEPAPPFPEEILCDLKDHHQCFQSIKHHLARHGITPAGVISFDCESMDLAARIASRLRRPYPSVQAVENCRNKYRSKMLWQEHGLETPAVACVRSKVEAETFFNRLPGACVLKPLSGSGSELIFHCGDADACALAFEEIQTRLHRRSRHPLYRTFHKADPDAVLAEEFVEGDEYSCDFIVDRNRVHIIRLTRKIPANNEFFGTTLGYRLLAGPPGEMDASRFPGILLKSAQALGLERALCMLDFILRGDRMILLELSPRPGGDCLPHLLRSGLNLDILKLYMDFSTGEFKGSPPSSHTGNLVGVRILAHRSGVLKRIDTTALHMDPRVFSIGFTRSAGHTIKMPPEDYDTWCLGHILAKLDDDSEPERQCRDMLSGIVLEMEQEHEHAVI